MTRETVLKIWAECVSYGTLQAAPGPMGYNRRPESAGKPSPEATLVTELVESCFDAFRIPIIRHAYREYAKHSHVPPKSGRCAPYPTAAPKAWVLEFERRLDVVVAGRIEAAKIAGDRD